MKRLIVALAMVCSALNGMAQDEPETWSDTTVQPEKDTIRVGNMIIIRSGKDRTKSYFDSTINHFRSDNPNVTTNWAIIDIGLSMVNDQTNYAAAIAGGMLPAGANEDWFDQRTIKSTNINIWVFHQRFNLVKHFLNLKYGAGIELNNYRYTENIRFQDNVNPLVVMDQVDYKKNKLAADYFTIPLMLNFNFTPRSNNHGYGVSAGVSWGFLYSSRQKTTGGPEGKHKERDDFDLRKVKLSYVGEVSLGPVRLYGSYAVKSMFKNTLDQRPYNIGLRLSNW